MPSPKDLTGNLYGLPKREQGRKRRRPGRLVATPRGRKIRVDWFFRGIWILTGLFVLLQFLLMALLS